MRLLAHDHVVQDGAVVVQGLGAGELAAHLGSLVVLSHFLLRVIGCADLVTACLGELLLRLLLLQVTVLLFIIFIIIAIIELRLFGGPLRRLFRIYEFLSALCCTQQ